LNFEQHRLTIETPGRALIEFTDRVDALLRGGSIEQGLCHLFIHHTSASLIVTENADGNVLRDLENYFLRLAPDGDPAYIHDQEGPDDMAAHIRSVLTQCELSIPITSGRLALGTWQGIFLWEHRYRPHRRNITVTLSGC
jgi:secondary thiamine-phosphate synthase enzyme